MTNLPTENCEYLSTDRKGPLHSREYILALIDYRTKYPVVAVMRSITSENIIKHLQKIFTTFGYPKKLRSHNGPQFTAGTFTEYLQSHNTEHKPAHDTGPKEMAKLNALIVQYVNYYKQLC